MMDIAGVSFIFLCSFMVIEDINVTCETVTVSAAVGQIAGYTENVYVEGNQRTITKFMSIPFAETTAGQNRFMKPVPKTPFIGTFQANKDPPACYQSSQQGTTWVRSYTNVTEDCLILNIYVPHDFKQNISLPVLVWVYGGGFVVGTSADYPADVLSPYTELVVVTINYRIGMFGFLQSSDGKLPGNQGLWDQHLAFQWVNNNIAAFSGDPSQVTIYGESAGSVSVSFQALYPGNKGLFQRVIASSGSSLAYWATLRQPNAEEYLKRVGCLDQDPISCLQKKTPHSLMLNQMPLDTLHFTPTVDGDFVTELPERILFGNNSKSAASREFYSSLVVLLGVNSMEGAMYLATTAPFLLHYTDINNPRITLDQFKTIIVQNVIDDFFGPISTEERHLLTAAISFQYTNWSDPTSFDSTRTETLWVAEDSAFFLPAYREVYSHSAVLNSKSYFYEFGVRVDKYRSNRPSWFTGAGHGDDVEMSFCYPLNYSTTPSYTAKDVITSKALATIFSNFVKSGDPNTPTDISKYTKDAWPQYNAMSQEYFEISEEISTKKRLHAERMAFWTDLIPKIIDRFPNT